MNMNCLSVINQSVNPNDTKLSDVFILFKNDLNNNIKDKVFYWIKNGDIKGEPVLSYGRYSGVRSIQIKRPIRDCFIQETFKVSKNMEFDHKN